MERKLRRSRDNRVLAGVCGGLGNFMGIDPVVIRIAVVLLTFFAGMSLWVYIIMWLLIPEE
ncbi:MAG: PspC domain-containing protein [Alistipes sp.]|nr:PspC domain-containing protein [Alistipes sp.]